MFKKKRSLKKTNFQNIVDLFIQYLIKFTIYGNKLIRYRNINNIKFKIHYL